jgi:hypothetical protein
MLASERQRVEGTFDGVLEKFIMSDVFSVALNSSTMEEVVYTGADGRRYSFAEELTGTTTWGNVGVSADHGVSSHFRL